MGAGAIRAGKAFVELLADDSKLQQTLQKVSANMRRWGAGLTLVGAGITATFLGMTKQFAESGAALDDMSQRTGFAVETLSKLDFAATQSGTQLESLERGLIGMARFTDNAARGLSTATDTLKALGLTLDDLKNKDPEELFRMLAARIAAVEDPTMKQALAMQVFGKSGQTLIPVLAEVGQLMDEAQARGLVISAEQAAEAAKLDDALDALSHQFKQIIVTVGSALAPLLSEHVEVLGRNVKAAAEWIKENQSLVVTLFKVGLALKVGGVLLTGMSTMAGLLTLLSGGTKFLTAGFAALVAATTAATGTTGAYSGAATTATTATAAWSSQVALLNTNMLTLSGTMGMASTQARIAGPAFTTAAAGATTFNTSLTALLTTARALLPVLLAIQFARTGIDMANPSLVGGGRTNRTPGSPESRGESRLRDLLQGKGEFAKPEPEKSASPKPTGRFALDAGIIPGVSPQELFQRHQQLDRLEKERQQQQEDRAREQAAEAERLRTEAVRREEELARAREQFTQQATSAIESGRSQLQGQLQSGTFSSDIRARHFDQRQQVQVELRDLSKEQKDLLVEILQKLELD